MKSSCKDESEFAFGFEELVRGDARSAIEAMQRMIETQVTNPETLKRRIAYLLTYSTYSFSSMSLSEVLCIYDTLSPYVEDANALNLIKERMASRIRFEDAIAANAAVITKNQYASAMQTRCNKIGCPVYCISIPRLRERQLRFHTNMSQLDCATVEYRGVDSESLDGMPGFIHGSLTLNEAACTLSHRTVWMEIQRERIPFAYIFEDDAIVTVLPKVEEMRGAGSDIDVVLLNNCILPDYTLVPSGFEIYGAENYLLPIQYGCGAYGYFVTLRGAEKLLDLFETVVAPVDIQMMAHSDAAFGTNERFERCRELRRANVRLFTKRLYPFVADHPPANFSAIAGRFRRIYCPGLWHGDQIS
jgi:hypothetical protein